MRFSTYQQLEEAYAREEVYPLDLKQGVSTHLNQVTLNVPMLYARPLLV